MTPDRLNPLWLLATGILILIILISSLAIWLGRDKGTEIIFSTQSNQPISTENIIIDGAVTNPGSYPLRKDDSLSDLIRAAGGQNKNADLSNLKVTVPQAGDATSPQRININRAESWLLQALPGIGEIRAQAVVDYRTKNGPFKNTEEIMLVPGFSPSTFEKVKELITISD